MQLAFTGLDAEGAPPALQGHVENLGMPVSIVEAGTGLRTPARQPAPVALTIEPHHTATPTLPPINRDGLRNPG